MRNMRSPLPIFIFIGLALIAVVGLIIMDSSARVAVGETNISGNASVKESVSLTMHDTEFGLIFGICSVLLIIAGYFALKHFG